MIYQSTQQAHPWKATARPAWHYDREGNKTECWQCSTCGFVYLTEHGANACGCKYGERRKGAKRAQTSGR